MQRLEVSGVVRLIYRSLGVEGLTRHQALYKINNKNKITIWQLEYICCICSSGIPNHAAVYLVRGFTMD